MVNVRERLLENDDDGVGVELHTSVTVIVLLAPIVRLLDSEFTAVSVPVRGARRVAVISMVVVSVDECVAVKPSVGVCVTVCSSVVVAVSAGITVFDRAGEMETDAVSCTELEVVCERESVGVREIACRVLDTFSVGVRVLVLGGGFDMVIIALLDRVRRSLFVTVGVEMNVFVGRSTDVSVNDL
jgi:hypothetical protein